MNESVIELKQSVLPDADERGMRAFQTIWFGQLVSIIGSAVSDFAIGVWVYQQTGSVFRFALIALAAVLPRLLMSPLAGVIVDRWNRRVVMLLADFAHALCSLLIWGLFATGRLEIWHLYVIVALAAAASSFQEPAYQAAIPQLVDRSQLGRANGMVDLSRGAGQLLAPLLGGFLIGRIGLTGIILIDLLTFLVAVVTLMLVRVPNVIAAAALGDVEGTDSAIPTASGGWWQEFRQGWSFLRSQPGLLMLMFYIAATVFLMSSLEVLVTPLILSFSNEQTLGLILTTGGIGMVVGGLVMSAWGGPKRRIYGTLIFDLLGALAMIAAGLRPSAILLALAAFCFFVGMPISRGSLQAIWQSSVPIPLQGRVFALRDMLAIAAAPLAFLVMGPLADAVFEPLMASDGALAGSVGQWIGSGPGRGIALLFIVMGSTFLTINLFAWRSKQVLNIEGV